MTVLALSMKCMHVNNMGGACAVVGCTFRGNRIEFKGKNGISLHLFPKNRKQREAWISAVGRKDWQPGKYSALCSQHFRPKDMDLTGQQRRLRKGAVPWVCRTSHKHLQRNVSTCKPSQVCDLSGCESNSTQEQFAFKLKEDEPGECGQMVTETVGVNLPDDVKCDDSEVTQCAPKVNHQCNCTARDFFDSGPTSPASDESSSSSEEFLGKDASEEMTLCRLELIKQLNKARAQLEKSRKQVNLLQAKLRRYSRKIESDKVIIASFEKEKQLSYLEEKYVDEKYPVITLDDD